MQLKLEKTKPTKTKNYNRPILKPSTCKWNGWLSSLRKHWISSIRWLKEFILTRFNRNLVGMSLILYSLALNNMIHFPPMGCMCKCKKEKYLIFTRHTKCSRQSSTAMIGGQLRLEIAARLLFPAFATIRGNTSILSV